MLGLVTWEAVVLLWFDWSVISGKVRLGHSSPFVRQDQPDEYAYIL